MTHENIDHGNLIEIYDSDDGDDVEVPTTDVVVPDRTETNAHIETPMEHSTNNQNSNVAHMTGLADLDSEYEVKPSVKDEPNAENEAESFDLELVVFDPNIHNGDAIASNKEIKSSKTHQTAPSSNAESSQSKRSDDLTHANGKLIGVKPDWNGLYHCNLCSCQFMNVGHFSQHMELHKNN